MLQLHTVGPEGTSLVFSLEHGVPIDMGSDSSLPTSTVILTVIWRPLLHIRYYLPEFHDRIYAKLRLTTCCIILLADCMTVGLLYILNPPVHSGWRFLTRPLWVEPYYVGRAV